MSRYISEKIFLATVALLFISAGIGTFYYSKYHRLVANDPNSRANEIIKRIERVIELPNEQPTIAQVADKTKLSSPILSKKAENGDEILVFASARRAILYRPSIEKVIDIYPLSGN